MMRRRAVIGVLALAIAGAAIAYFALRNRAPVAVDDRPTMVAGTVAIIDVLANDKDPDGDLLSVTTVTAGKNGETKIMPDGKVEYRPQQRFFGEDRFTYTISDGRGGEATANITVEVKLKPPVFLRRRESASLLEMMQQPPTNVYGSSINVFVYGPTNQIAEVTVTGHADTLTCTQASGAVMGTLLRKRASADEFLIAGTGRLVGGAPVTAEMANDPAVRIYREASRALREAEINDAGANELEALKAKADQAEADPKVQAYIAAAVSQPALESLLREAERLAAGSGLVRIHRLPVKVLELARERVTRAVGEKVMAVVEFRDLLRPQEEAAVTMPMLSTRTGEPIIIDVAAGEFSKQGFAEAVKQHRDAVETAIIGNARSRADFAKNKTKENISEQKYCATLSQAKLNETVEMNETCTPDGCVRISGGRKIARRAYCEIQLRQNQKIFEAWLKEAEAILARMEADQKSRSGRTLSEFTHATLIDSMLRDWALPVGDTQAAFEHWRVNRRAAAWETLTRELDRMGIDRRALAGENVVFLATINDDRLKIRPVMVVDLQRSVVVVDERVGATAVVDAWGERRDGQAADPMTEAPTLAAVSRATPTVQASLERDPAQTMSRLLSLWAAEISRTDPDRDQRLAKAKQMAEFENASAAANLVATLDTAGYDDWKKQVIPVINTVIESRHISPETLLRAALSIAKRVTSGDPSASSSETPAAWSFLADAADKPSAGMLALPRFREIEAHFGLSPSLLVYNFKQRARSLDASFIDTALRERAWPKEASAIEQRYRAIRTSPQTRIDLEVSATHMISSALKQRSLVLASYRTLLDDEATRARRWELVSDHLTRANEIETTSDVNGELDHVLAKIRAQQQNTVGQDTIVRHQLAAQLNRIATRLMSVADIYNRYSDRYSSDHELLSARVAFENGAYAEALRRYFSFELPVALWAPNLTWRVLEGDFRGVPNGLRSTVDADELVLSARRGADWVDIMRIRGAKMDALRQLGAALVEAVSAGKGSVWWDGEQVSDKILTLEIPVRPELAEAAKAIRGEGAGVATQRSTLWLQVLKAMVYTCTPPAVGLIDLSGRCRSESKATARHDRVSIGGGAVMVPDLEAVKRVAQTKFAVP